MSIIAVTGSDGFVGKHITAALKKCGNQVIELDLSNGHDLSKPNSLDLIPRFDTLIHLASKSFVPISFSDPYSFYYSNYIMTLNLLEKMRSSGGRIIYFSSYIYGNPQYLPIDENHPLNPHNPYAQTKLICENLCCGYNRDFNIPIIIFRPFNIYGSGQTGQFLIPEILRQIKTGKITLADPKPKRDFIFIDDVVSAVKLAIDYNETNYEIFNIGSGTSYSVEEIVNIIAELVKFRGEIKYKYEIRKGEILETLADNTKMLEILKWRPKVKIEKGILEILKNQNL